MPSCINVDLVITGEVNVKLLSMSVNGCGTLVAHNITLGYGTALPAGYKPSPGGFAITSS